MRHLLVSSLRGCAVLPVDLSSIGAIRPRTREAATGDGGAAAPATPPADRPMSGWQRARMLALGVVLVVLFVLVLVAALLAVGNSS